MTINEYQEAALRTASSLNPDYPRLLNGVMGLSGESGEVIDMLKKHIFQGHDLDYDHVVKELGDIAWYLAISADAIGVDLESVLRLNIEKLEKRYPDGFKISDSVNRNSDDI